MKTLRSNRPSATSLAALLVLLASITAPCQTTHSYRVIALSGDPTPTAGATATYSVLGTQPSIGAGGHVTFGSHVGFNGSSNYAIWTGLPGEIVALVVEGDPAPGRLGETFDASAYSTSADYKTFSDGSVAFRSKCVPSGDNGLWFGTPGNLQNVILENSDAPGIAGAIVNGFPGFAANGAGDVFIRGHVEGPGVGSTNDHVLWISRSGVTSIVAREGDFIPGLAGATFDVLTALPLSVNTAGSVCFKARIDTGPNGSRDAIFSGLPGALFSVVQEGNAIPILPGFEWDSLAKPRMNNAGEIVFEAVPEDNGNKSFFVRSANGAISRICELDSVAAGAGADAWKGLAFADPFMGGNGHAAFHAGLGENPRFAQDGVWLASGGTTKLVAKKGDAAPGLAGQVFAKFEPPVVNASGIVVFEAQTDFGTDGIWLHEAGANRLIAAVGDQLLIAPGDVRGIGNLSIKTGSGGQSGHPTCFNDSGQLVFRVGFNSGIIGTAVLLVGNACDLDGGGTKCLLEDAFGGDPNSSADDFAILPSARREGDNFVLSFRRRTDGSFIYEVQNSAGLGAWVPAVGAPVPNADQTGLPAGFERVDFRIPVVSGGHDNLRIEVTRN